MHQRHWQKITQEQHAEIERLKLALAQSLRGPEAPIDLDRWLEKLAEIERLRSALRDCLTLLASDGWEENPGYKRALEILNEQQRRDG